MAKGRRNYAIRKCGKPAKKADCNTRTSVCLNCTWPQMQASLSAAAVAAKSSGNNVLRAA